MLDILVIVVEAEKLHAVFLSPSTHPRLLLNVYPTSLDYHSELLTAEDVIAQSLGGG